MITLICLVFIGMWHLISIIIWYITYDSDGEAGWFFTISTQLIIAIIGATCYCCSPKAIDVYRDKTELKIIYEGTTPTDSVVIYKNNK